jgi:tRNA (uracil-5-)-methyltransferase
MDSTEYNLENYLAQLEEKKNRVLELFSSLTVPSLEVFSSPESHFRMRAEFRVWHDGEDLYYYMYDKVTEQKIRLDSFPVASLLINQVMEALMLELRPNHVLRKKLFQVDFLSTLSGEILVTLLYHRPLESDWINEATSLKKRLTQKFKLDLIGRARKQMFVIDRDFVEEVLVVNGNKFYYKQIENSFTQPNAIVATKMLEWVQDITRGSKGDLLELYCGNGNFSLALAGHFRKVLATELAKPSVEAANYNILKNKINNVQIFRMSAEDFSDAMNQKRDYNRLKGIDLKSYDCQTILVDPPRAGLDERTLELVSRYEKIIYISCNPHTLIDNLKVLSTTHNISRLAIFDQFPYTEHIESGLLLTKK